MVRVGAFRNFILPLHSLQCCFYYCLQTIIVEIQSGICPLQGLLSALSSNVWKHRKQQAVSVHHKKLFEGKWHPFAVMWYINDSIKCCVSHVQPYRALCFQTATVFLDMSLEMSSVNSRE